MTKKAEVELLLPPKQSPLDQLAEAVARKLRVAGPLPLEYRSKSTQELSKETLLEPWFLPREVSWAIVRLIPLAHRRKFQRYFKRWGCLKCGKKSDHASNGLCGKCHTLITARLRQCFHAGGKDEQPAPEELIAELVSKVAGAEAIFGNGMPTLALLPKPGKEHK